MELRTASSPRDVKTYDTQRLREEFLIDDLFRADDIKLVYSHIDRIITGSAVPVKGTLALTAGEELRAQYFLERRELGVINIGGEGTVTVDGTVYTLRHEMLAAQVVTDSGSVVFSEPGWANVLKPLLALAGLYVIFAAGYIALDRFATLEATGHLDQV